MRDLRSNVRVFTEPVTIFLKEEITENGITRTSNTKQVKVFGNVMVNKDIDSFDNGSNHNNNSIKITIRSNNINIEPELTSVMVRNKHYLVKAVNDFAINAEYLTFTAQRIE